MQERRAMRILAGENGEDEGREEDAAQQPVPVLTAAQILRTAYQKLTAGERHIRTRDDIPRQPARWASEEFVIERLIGKMVADGGDVPGREGEKVPAGTVLYKVLWEGFPPEIATWEEEDQIPCGEVDFVEQYEASLAEEEAEGEAEAEDSESDGE